MTIIRDLGPVIFQYHGWYCVYSTDVHTPDLNLCCPLLSSHILSLLSVHYFIPLIWLLLIFFQTSYLDWHFLFPPLFYRSSSVLGRLALKKIPLEAASVAPKSNDHLKEVEKDEYPTHLSVRISLVSFCFVLFCYVMLLLSHFLIVTLFFYWRYITCQYVIADVHVLSYSFYLTFLTVFISFLHVACYAQPTDETHLYRQRVRWTESLCSGQGARSNAHS